MPLKRWRRTDGPSRRPSAWKDCVLASKYTDELEWTVTLYKRGSVGVKLFFFYCEPSGPASFGLDVHSQHSFLLLMKLWRAPDYWEIKRVESLLSSVRSKKDVPRYLLVCNSCVLCLWTDSFRFRLVSVWTLLWFKKWKSNDTVDCAYTWTNKLMNKDGVDDAHRVIVSRAAHSVVARVTKRGTLEISERFFFVVGQPSGRLYCSFTSVKKRLKTNQFICFFFWEETGALKVSSWGGNGMGEQMSHFIMLVSFIFTVPG